MPASDACLVTANSAGVDSASIVITSPVNLQNAPRPTTWGERFVFDLAHDTAQLDCRGRPTPDAAGPYQIYQVRGLGGLPLHLQPIPGAHGPHLTIHSVSEANARDLVDAGVDLLLTDSPTLAAYAGARSDVTSLPLGWDRTWVVVTPRGSLAIDTSQAFRAGLARDAVRADARAAEGPFWWTDTTGCAMPTVRTALAPVGTHGVAYPRDDAVARALAERLVAVLGDRMTAVGLAPNAFASALTSASEYAYVFPLPRMTRDRCRSIAELFATTTWLGVQGAIVPLIDTRLRAVARRDRLALRFTWDSTVAIVAGHP